ncbi:MAG: hypothetical protein LBD72_00610 [Puniceicoccales bacterium]|jgi:hypothetical protein|nr:hypothetical protein [Puniceicoccales bacterium]
MSNSISFVPTPASPDADCFSAQPEHDADVAVRHMAAVVNRARVNVADAQGRLNNFRETGNREEFGAFIGDWGRLDFEVFADLIAGVLAIYRALGPHTLDERRWVLIAVLDQIRTAETTEVAIDRKQINDIRALVVEVADGTQNAQILGLTHEINERLPHLKNVNSDGGRQKSLSLSQTGFLHQVLDGDGWRANANLARSMLADAQRQNEQQRAEGRKQILEDRLESDDLYSRLRAVQQKRSGDAVQVEKIYGETRSSASL